MTAQPTFKVVPDGPGWIVVEAGQGTVGGRYERKEAAVGAARQLAEERAPSHLVVHDAVGNVIWSAVFSGHGDEPG